MRLLLVDRIVELESGQSARAIKNVTLSEDFLEHHFRERPVMPGTFIAECLVQLADWIIRESSTFQQLGLLVGLSRLKLRRMVTPGDQLLLEVKLRENEGDLARFDGRAHVGDTVAASAEFELQRCPLEAFESRAEAERLLRLIGRWS